MGILRRLWREQRGGAISGRSMVVGAVVAASIFAGGYAVGGGGGGAAGTANIWIDTSGGTCADSASLISYPNNGTECADLAAAVAVADPGDTIGWHAGTYTGNLTVAYNASLYNLSPGCDPLGTWGSVSTTNCVTIVPDGNVTQNGSVFVTASNLYFKGTPTGTISNPTGRTYQITVNGGMSAEAVDNNGYTSGFPATVSTQFPDYVTYQGITMPAFTTSGGTHIRLTQSAIGGYVMADASCNWTDYQGNALSGTFFESKVDFRYGISSDNLVYDHNYWHDVSRNSAGAAASCHGGALRVEATGSSSPSMTISNSVWSGVWVYDGDFNGFADNMLIENNMFGCDVEAFDATAGPPYPSPTCSGQAALQFHPADSPTHENWLVRYNSSVNALAGCYQVPCAYSNVRFVGNVGTILAGGDATDPCNKPTGVSVLYNTWVGGTCDATDNTDASLAAMFTTTTTGSENLHLQAGSNANNHVTPTTSDYTLTTDIDGDSRTAGSRDAGADER